VRKLQEEPPGLETRSEPKRVEEGDTPALRGASNSLIRMSQQTRSAVDIAAALRFPARASGLVHRQAQPAPEAIAQ
jgi:hypothetical protein